MSIVAIDKHAFFTLITGINGVFAEVSGRIRPLSDAMNSVSSSQVACSEFGKAKDSLRDLAQEGLVQQEEESNLLSQVAGELKRQVCEIILDKVTDGADEQRNQEEVDRLARKAQKVIEEQKFRLEREARDLESQINGFLGGLFKGR